MHDHQRQIAYILDPGDMWRRALQVVYAVCHYLPGQVSLVCVRLLSERVIGRSP